MSEQPATPVQDIDSEKDPGQKSGKKLYLLAGGGGLLLAILVAVSFIWGLPGSDADEETPLETPVPTPQEETQKLDIEQVIEIVSGRYTPAHMNDEGLIISLGDCRHTYIEIDQEGIHRKSGNRSGYRESFQTLTLSEPGDHPESRTVLTGQTEGTFDTETKGSSIPIPQRRSSDYQIAYIEDEDQTYLTISQTDQFEHSDGRRETVSSQGYYLPCPSKELGGT